MNNTERYNRWHGIADTISVAINSLALLQTKNDYYGSGAKASEIQDAKEISQLLTQAFTKAKRQYMRVRKES